LSREDVEDGKNQREALVALLNVLPMGVILLDAQGEVLDVNDRAAALLRAGDGLGIEGRRLRAANHAATGALRRMITRVTMAGSHETDESGNVLLLRRPSGQHRLEMLVVAIDPNAGHLFAPSPPAAVAFVGDPERGPALQEETLRKCYELTHVEALIAIDLAHGATVGEIADRLGVQANTVRWHVKQILAKTGTRRQAELVRLLLISPLALVDVR